MYGILCLIIDYVGGNFQQNGYDDDVIGTLFFDLFGDGIIFGSDMDKKI